MAKLKYLVIHCTDTKPGVRVTKDMLDDWHRAPRKNVDGTITYLGKTYPSLKDAPISEKHRGKWGRGWDRLGYSDMIHIDGTIENLTPYNDDDEVQAHEITWGATGVNATGRHVVYVGGKCTFGLSSLNDAQFIALQRYTKQFLHLVPDGLIAGHNHFSGKLCPNFNVVEFCQLIAIPTNNILTYGTEIW